MCRSGLDPIEKKPLYHFYPGSTILSFGALGCNFRCDFCQNWQIAQARVPTQELKPEGVVQSALRWAGIVSVLPIPTQSPDVV